MKELVSAALLGTDRKPPPGDHESPAERLLGQAALATVRARAGYRPVTCEPIAPAPAETAPAAPSRHLEMILGGEHAELLPEWLATAAHAGFRVPARLLPELLGKGRSDRSLRRLIAAACGRRGMWLAMRNPDWAYLVLEAGGDWETGARGQRLAYLTDLRATDPAAALDTLRQTWNTETAPDRAAFLHVLAAGLSLADEEFLEQALDDRGKDARQIAADLLATLPGSAYGRRMAERARQIGLGETVSPPYDATMRRDGIPEKGRLRELVARTPLSVWPPDALRLVAGDEYETDLLDGWTRAAIRQRDVGWARALPATPESLAVLPADERRAGYARLIRDVEDGQRLMKLFEAVPGPWEGELAEAVVDTFARRGERDPRSWVLTHLCKLAAARLVPDTDPRLEALGRDSWPLAELAATLRFRHDMLKELS